MDRKDDKEAKVKPIGVNPGYAASQIAKALTTSEEHTDPATRERAKEKITRWEGVLKNILAGRVDYGSRTPVENVPGWATLEVVTGGFATGELLAGGPIQEHEKELLKVLPPCSNGEERRNLNAYFLSDTGLAELRERLKTGRYDIAVPEEAALMVVAWLAENKHADEARTLLEQLSPYLNKLRFYPNPSDQPRRYGSRVHLQDVATTVGDLEKIEPNQQILAQKEAVEIWAPIYDRMVALFLETVDSDWPCRRYSSDWGQRAKALTVEYADLRKRHSLCGKPERKEGHFAQLRQFLKRCADRPASLNGREVGRIRLILKRYTEKRGLPESERCVETRRRQLRDVSAPMFHQIARAVLPRLERHPNTEGVEDVSHLNAPVGPEETKVSGVPAGTLVPVSIQRKVERCLNETVQELVKRDLITSGETLARLLPQMTSGLRAAGISDPTLRQLYAATYRAFRRRRSLLLLNLEKQIQIEELPWVAAIEQFRNASLSNRELAQQALEEISALTITSFPHALIPNKLLQELRALAKSAALEIPLVEEVAADIFMGEFSGKFLTAAKRTADLLDGTLYASYYGINYAEVRRIPETVPEPKKKTFLGFDARRKPDPFVQLCASRAGVELGTWKPATNGMIIEQQQILTSQNLAVLFMELGLTETLRHQLTELSKECFKWVCRRHQMKIDKWHARLIMVKNTAYAWRQMMFFLSLQPKNEQGEFLEWAANHLAKQSEPFQRRFHPVLRRIIALYQDEPNLARSLPCFLGWTNSKHWLLSDAEPSP